MSGQQLLHHPGLRPGRGHRGTDDYDYVIKTNSWTGGGLPFGTNTASFSGKCNVAAINPATGLRVTGIGGGNFVVHTK